MGMRMIPGLIGSSRGRDKLCKGLRTCSIGNFNAPHLALSHFFYLKQLNFSNSLLLFIVRSMSVLTQPDHDRVFLVKQRLDITAERICFMIISDAAKELLS